MLNKRWIIILGILLTIITIICTIQYSINYKEQFENNQILTQDYVNWIKKKNPLITPQDFYEQWVKNPSTGSIIFLSKWNPNSFYLYNTLTDKYEIFETNTGYKLTSDYKVFCLDIDKNTDKIIVIKK